MLIFLNGMTVIKVLKNKSKNIKHYERWHA